MPFITAYSLPNSKGVALLLQDDDACLKGGASGLLYCDWLRVDGLWVDDSLRHRGIGTELMIRAKNHAVAKGCHSAWLDTFQARGFYKAVGYELFGMLNDYPAGQTQHFLEKATCPVTDRSMALMPTAGLA